MRKYKIAVVGATGMVGGEMIRMLEERNFPVENLRAFATKNTAGSKISFGGKEITVEDIAENLPEDLDMALFAGGEIASRHYAKKAARTGCAVIDNSAEFRMDPAVPLVVPEVNAEALREHKGIIANPNCSTIQMVAVLHPLHRRYRIKRVVVSTYQSVSGTGKAAVEELRSQSRGMLAGEMPEASVYPQPIAFNILPHIGSFDSDGYSSEETKMRLETVKIMGDPALAVNATTVRVPVERGHCEALNIEMEKAFEIGEIRKLLEESKGLAVLDDPGAGLYPTALSCAGRNPVYVGRIRRDLSRPNTLDLWIAADNLLKGAALNAVQIAETLIRMDLLKR